MGIVFGPRLQQGGLARRCDDVPSIKAPWTEEVRRQQFLAFYELLDQIGTSIVELCLRFALSSADASTLLVGRETLEHVEAKNRYRPGFP